MQQSEKVATRWNQQEKERKVERSRETERETDIQRFPFTHCLPRVIPLPPENGALCLAVGELTFTTCLLLLWLFSPLGVIASLPSPRNNAASELRELGMWGRIRPRQTFYWNTMTACAFELEGKRLLNHEWQPVTSSERKWHLTVIVTLVEFISVTR